MAPVANASREKLKRSLLLAFVAIGVALAALTWAGNLDEQSQPQPGFYRPTLSEPPATPTPEAPTAAPSTSTPGPTPTPLPTIED
jgi:hypothetical protein